MSNDAADVQRVLAGNVDAYAALVDRYYDRCARYAIRMLGSRDDAEDALQATFLRAYRALNPTQTMRYPSPKSRTASGSRPLPRPACAPANRSSIGAADAAIMPTIITDHIVNVKKTSASVHGTSSVMPMSAIIVSYSIEDDI